MAEKGRSEYRVDQQPAFVLHTYPWRETSLIVEFLLAITDVFLWLHAEQNDQCLNTADCLILSVPWQFPTPAKAKSKISRAVSGTGRFR